MDTVLMFLFVDLVNTSPTAHVHFGMLTHTVLL